MSMVVSAWIGGAMTAAACAGVSSAIRSAPISSDGWRRLRPGGMINLALVFGAALSWLPIVLLLSDSPIDRRSGNVLLCLALLLVFGGMTLCIGWLYYIRRIEWLGDRFRVWVPIWGKTYYDFADVAALTPSWDGTDCKVLMKTGSVIRISIYLRGCEGLIRSLDRYQTGIGAR